MAEALFHFVETDSANLASQVGAQLENSTRFASVQCTYESTGLGQFRVGKPIIFPVVFRTEPFFTSGSGVIKNPDPKGYLDPVGQSGVYQWEVDERGYFVGAWMWVKITATPKDHVPAHAQNYQQALAELDAARLGTAAKNRMKVQHYMAFSAIAIKDVPVPPAGAALKPRTVGI
jgi:hypothetical protein